MSKNLKYIVTKGDKIQVPKTDFGIKASAFSKGKQINPYGWIKPNVMYYGKAAYGTVASYDPPGEYMSNIGDPKTKVNTMPKDHWSLNVPKQPLEEHTNYGSMIRGATKHDVPDRFEVNFQAWQSGQNPFIAGWIPGHGQYYSNDFPEYTPKPIVNMDVNTVGDMFELPKKMMQVAKGNPFTTSNPAMLNAMKQHEAQRQKGDIHIDGKEYKRLLEQEANIYKLPIPQGESYEKWYGAPDKRVVQKLENLTSEPTFQDITPENHMTSEGYPAINPFLSGVKEDDLQTKKIYQLGREQNRYTINTNDLEGKELVIGDEYDDTTDTDNPKYSWKSPQEKQQDKDVSSNPVANQQLGATKDKDRLTDPIVQGLFDRTKNAQQQAMNGLDANGKEMNVGDKTNIKQDGSATGKFKSDSEAYGMGDKAQNYFNFLKAIDIGAAVKNFAQGPPPTIQVPITHMERVKLDRNEFDTMRAQNQEQGNASYRNLRENVSQASDLLKGVQAINAGQMEANRQVGLQEQALVNQERTMNNQIANQEAHLQDSQNLQEQQLNYDIQANARNMKNQMESQALGELKKDVMLETQYGLTKGAMDRQEAEDRRFADKNEAIQVATLGYEASKNFDQTPEYQTELMTELSGKLNEIHPEISKDLPLFSNLNSQQAAKTMIEGERMVNQKLQEVQPLIQEQQKLAQQMESETDPGRKSEIENRLKELDASIKTSGAAQAIEAKKQIEEYKRRLQSKYDYQGFERDFKTQYTKNNRIMTTPQYTKTLQNIVGGNPYLK